MTHPRLASWSKPAVSAALTSLTASILFVGLIASSLSDSLVPAPESPLGGGITAAEGRYRNANRNDDKLVDNDRNANRDPEDRTLTMCSTAPMTGWHRSGRCAYHPDDGGAHLVCAKVTDEFLVKEAARGNDLRRIPLKGGDSWCICAAVFERAHRGGYAPPVDLRATNAKAFELRTTSLEHLEAHDLQKLEGKKSAAVDDQGEAESTEVSTDASTEAEEKRKEL